MPGVFSVLSLASRAMWASQTGVEVASHNVANMNTPGYAKQTVMYNPATPISSKGLLLGNGVTISDIRSVQDRYLNYQMFNSTSLLGFAEARSTCLSAAQEIFNETDEIGLSPAIANFFSSLQDLSTVPEGQAERTSLIGRAKVLANQFHVDYNRLTDLQNSADTSIREQMEQVNNLARQIRDLNQNIRSQESTGQTAGDFRAMRTQLMIELSELVDFSSFEYDDGTVNIVLAGGMPLVEQNFVGKLVGVGNAEGFLDVNFEDISGNRTDISDAIKGGAIGGCLKIRDEDIENIIDQLNEMAFVITNEINAVHNSGFGLNGSTGLDFFVPLASADGAAAAIEVDPSVLADVNNVAASLTGEPGDNQNALALVALEDALLFNGGTWTFQDFHGSIIGQVGVEAQSAIRETTHQATMTEQVEGLRESLSGVTMEEEMADLMRFQYSFSAAGKLFNVVSEMIETLNQIR